MKMIWDDKSPKSVLSYVQNVIDRVRAGKVPTEDLIARARLGKWLPTTDDHYGDGATNPNAKPKAFDSVDQCYVNLSGNQKGAAWHNIVLANDSYPKIDRGDSFAYTFVKDGPTWIPEGGYVGFHDFSQIKKYELDIEKIIEKNIIGKLDHIMYGIGLSNDMLRQKGKYEGKKLSMSDFQ